MKRRRRECGEETEGVVRRRRECNEETEGVVRRRRVW